MSTGLAEKVRAWEPDFGPKMKALPNDRWRRFVQHLVISGGKSKILCARDAGFTGSDDALHNTAWRLSTDKRIQEAIIEVTRGDLNLFVPAAVRRLKQAVDDPQNTNGEKAAVEILNRTGLHATQEVNHVHSLSGDTERLTRLAALAKGTGLDLGALLGGRLSGKVIDVPFEDVTPPSPHPALGIEDLI